MTSSPDLVLPRIFAAIDDHRFDELPAFYTADVQAETAVGHIDGRDRLVAAMRAIHEPVPVLQHLVTGVIVVPHGDDAEVRANIVATFCDKEHRPTLEGGSVWRGRLRRVADGRPDQQDQQGRQDRQDQRDQQDRQDPQDKQHHWQVYEFSLDLVWSRGEIPAEWGVAG